MSGTSSCPFGTYFCEYLWKPTLGGGVPDHYSRELNQNTDGSFYLAYDNHRGIDFKTTGYPSPTGVDGFTYVCAAHDGWLQRREDGLNTLAIAGSGESAGYTTLYSHLSARLLAPDNREAQRVAASADAEAVVLLADLVEEKRDGVRGYVVTAGQIIGISGDVGSEEHPHLHFGLLNSDDRRVDPFGWDGDPPEDPNVGAPSFYIWKSSVKFASLK